MSKLATTYTVHEHLADALQTLVLVVNDLEPHAGAELHANLTGAIARIRLALDEVKWIRAQLADSGAFERARVTIAELRGKL